MRNLKLFGITFSLFALSVLINSCKSPEVRLAEKIDKIEKAFKADSTKIPEKTEVVNLINLYSEFTEKYPQSKKTPDFLFNAGRYCMSFSLSTKAVEFFDKLILKYPDYQKLPDCYFLKGFVYDSQLSNLPMARKSYEQLIEKYPNHELALQAKQLINILGKNLDEVIAGFEENKKEEPGADVVKK